MLGALCVGVGVEVKLEMDAVSGRRYRWRRHIVQHEDSKVINKYCNKYYITSIAQLQLLFHLF